MPENVPDHDLEDELRRDRIEKALTVARVLVRRGQYAEAIRSCQEALALEPDHAHAHEVLGDGLAGLGQFAEAMAEYRRAFELDPRNADAERKIGAMSLRVAKVSSTYVGESDSVLGATERKPGCAAGMAAAFPGLGQLYNREAAKGFVMVGVALLLAVFIIYALFVAPVGTWKGIHPAGEKAPVMRMWAQGFTAMSAGMKAGLLLACVCFVTMHIWGIVDASNTAKRLAEAACEA